MNRIFTVIFLFLSLGAHPEAKTADISFFNKKLTVPYDNAVIFEQAYKPGEDGYFEGYYQKMEAAPYTVLLDFLLEKKKELRLNDWLYSLLLKKSVYAVFEQQKAHFRSMFLWFMLNKSGYETRLEFKGKDITVSVFSFDLVYGVPQAKGKGGFYIDLTSFDNELDYKDWEPFRLNFNPNKGKETIPFSFIIKEMPGVFESVIVKKDISFTHEGKEYRVGVELDSGYVDLLKGYPELSVLKHTEMPLSPPAYQSLLPFLKKHTEGMDSCQTMRFLMSFCRTGFNFKKDELAFSETPYFGTAGLRVIFTPEESLFNKYLDSEDISVLFYYLAKEVLNPEMVLLKYGKQVSLAAFLHKKVGVPITYNNKPYALCDVSENDNSVEIGQTPKSLTGKYPSFIEK